MLKIRLKKFGRKKKACYRIIIVDSRKKRDSKAIKEIGFYNPLNKQSKIDTVEIKNRIKEGAKLTKTVKDLVKKNYQ
uniref:Small ribosomal subunit protein bS16c n=1 Tax=Bostrychia simpliciuscula TaxID=324754 RepID=A0A1Z1M879_9FLOR|nr:ribosomal protein S16 [Bostrychia simpliciuscula]ARW62180.1 ribosomal protein S16 [Bostrychia simpliciuscula]